MPKKPLPTPTPTPWLEFAKTAAWPVCAVLIVALFFAPIKALLQNSVDKRASITELKVGILEIKLSPGSRVQTDPPDEAVAKLAASLDSDDIRWLMEWEGKNTSSGACNGQMAPMESDLWGSPSSPTRIETRLSNEKIEREIARAAATQSRIKKGLLAFENIRGKGLGGAACAPDASGRVSLTPIAWKTKFFLVELLAESLKLSVSR